MTAPARNEESDVIACIVARFIPDHAHIQTGIGGAPGALWGQLSGHKGLILRSGMANDGLRQLADAGALADVGHVAGIAYGSLDFYRYLADTGLVTFASTPQTHGFSGLAQLPRLHAVNSALEVDLFGQVNAEWQGGRLSSGVGGAADFTRAALASPGGRSIIALPATAKAGTISRIVTSISAPAIGLPRTDIDTVVTEHGAVELRQLSMDARAAELISIAAPPFRDDLARGWSEMRKCF
jgi:acyl-CoA hydrolase